MIVYARPLFDPTSAPPASPRPFSTTAGRKNTSAMYRHPCIRHLEHHFDFGFPDTITIKRRPRQHILGSWCLVRIFGFMKRTISTAAYVISLIHTESSTIVLSLTRDSFASRSTMYILLCSSAAPLLSLYELQSDQNPNELVL